MMLLQRLISGPGMPRSLARAAWSAALLLLAAPWATAQVGVTFNYTGAVQTYTVPPGIYAIYIKTTGGGGGGGGSDIPGDGGAGGRGAVLGGYYSVVPGTVLKLIVGGGGGGGGSNVPCSSSAGAGGLAGGTGGFAGGIGGRAGCTGVSGGGGGGGAATVVTTQSDVMLMVSGGGGGGQGGALNLPGRDGLTRLIASSMPGVAGSAGGTVGGGNGGGGGGGGGGCSGGAAGGAANPDGPGPNTTSQAQGGIACYSAALTSVTLNSTGGIGGNGGAGGTGSAAPGASGAAGSVAIFYPTLILTKSQPNPALAVGADSVYTLTIQNQGPVTAYSARVVDQLPSNMTYVSSSGTGWSCSPAANAGGTLVTCDFTGTINSVGGTSPALQITARPTNYLSVTNYAAVDISGSTSPPVPTTCTAINVPTGCAAPVVSLVTVTVSGYGYEDLNNNNARDAGEIGRVFPAQQYVKLTTRTGSVCNFPAIAVASIGQSPGLGDYSFADVAPGNYCLLLQLTNSLATNDPGYGSGFIGTENPSGVIRFTVGGSPLPPQNFGFLRSARVMGIVFADNGAGGGIANNGVKAGTEQGLAGVTVILTRGGTELARAVTSSDGSFTIFHPEIAVGPATITPVLPGGYTATGGSAGTLNAGSYTRPSVNYTTIGGRNDSGVTFGMVAPNALAPNGAQTAQPATDVFHAHTYTAATGGQVTFTLASAASPANPAWSQVLYRDSNCSATLEAGEPQVTAAITVTAGQKVCLIVKQFVPAGAGLGAQNAVTLSAAFSYTNAAPALGISTLSAIDVTTVGQAGDLALGKLVSNVTQALAAATSVPAKPGDTLQYTLTATNNGTQPLSTLFVSDSTTAFTGFVSTACPGVLPAGITGCTVTAQPAVGAQGALRWTFTGALRPGAQVVVTYNVKLDQ